MKNKKQDSTEQSTRRRRRFCDGIGATGLICLMIFAAFVALFEIGF